MADKVQFSPSLNTVKARLRGRLSQMKNLSIPNRQIELYLDSWVQRNFQTEGGKVGGWTPFKRGGRVLRGGRIDKAAKLLQNTGRLRASFQGFHTAKRVGIRTNLNYAQYHEFGTAHLPIRRMLPRERDVIRPIIQIYKAHIESLNRRNFI